MVKEEYIEIFKKYIKRDGANQLLAFLTDESKSDFFKAPASTRFHLACEGGLAEHSINVYKRLKKLVEAEDPSIKAHISDESIAICGLLHDICKINLYTVEMRNVKLANGTWGKEPYYKVEEKFPFGHGEKSVFMIGQYIKLTGDEALAINWHMGAYDDRVSKSYMQLSAAYQKSPLTVLMHAADLLASQIDEVE